MLRSFDVRPPDPSGRATTPMPSTRPDSLPMPRFVKKKKKKSHGLLTVVIAGLVLILAATVGGLYLFGGWGSSRGGVEVSIDAPRAVTSGDEVRYRIAVTNHESLLSVADLTLEYPVGFVISSVTPQPANPGGQSLFHLAPVAIGQSVEVEVVGRLLGAVGSAAELRARLDYQPENFHSNFSVEAAAVTQVAAGRLRLEVDAPSRVVSPGQLPLSIVLQNVSDAATGSMEVVLELPGGTNITSSTPPLSTRAAGELRFDVASIEPGGRWAAQLVADVVGDTGSHASVAVAVYQRLGQQRVIIERTLHELDVVQPSVDLQMYVGQSTSSASATWGSWVPVQLALRSSSTMALEDLSLRLRIAGLAVDWGQLTDLSGGRRDGDAIVWDRESSSIGSSLRRLDPLSEASITLSLPIVAVPTEDRTVMVVATLTSAAFGDDWQAAAGPVAINVQ